MEDLDYKRVARTTVSNASESFDVSTVWLGIDHGFGDGAPTIFETMVFRSGKWTDLECARYATEAEARKGHATMVATVAGWLTDAEVTDASW
jgi:hypothetical protein